jgi:hypothetical protein
MGWFENHHSLIKGYKKYLNTVPKGIGFKEMPSISAANFPDLKKESWRFFR